MDEDDIVNMIMGQTGKPKMPNVAKQKVPAKNKSMSKLKAKDFNSVTTSRFKGDGKAPKTVDRTGAKSSLHGLNKIEQAARDTYAEDAASRKASKMKKRKNDEIANDPTTPVKNVENAVQLYDEQNGGGDASALWSKSGKEAFAELGIKANPSLAAFWDRADEEDRYYILEALKNNELNSDDTEKIMQGTVKASEEDAAQERILQLMGETGEKD